MALVSGAYAFVEASLPPSVDAIPIIVGGAGWGAPGPTPNLKPTFTVSMRGAS